MGNFKVGYTKGELEPAKTTDKYGTNTADTATALGGDAYESDGLGIEFAVNDQLSISYTKKTLQNVHKTMAATASTNTRNFCNFRTNNYYGSIQYWWCYIGVSLIDTDNSDYTAGREETKLYFL